MAFNIKMSGGKCPGVPADGVGHVSEDRNSHPPGVAGDGAISKRRLKCCFGAQLQEGRPARCRRATEEDVFHQVPSLRDASPQKAKEGSLEATQLSNAQPQGASLLGRV